MHSGHTNIFYSESLRDYFSQFGDVQECTVMRDGATGRSRGFGFLTFRDAKTVNTVMVKEHYLDGKIVRTSHFDVSPSAQASFDAPSQRLTEDFPDSYPTPGRGPKKRKRSLRVGTQIDPKRAIPRDEQEKTSKIFVGGVSQEATEQDFKEFFMKFGRVVDATLMMDKDTGRPRGFGFVTFDGEAAVDRCLEYHPLEILGKPIEVKKAQPRGKIGEEDDGPRGGRGGRNKFGREDRYNDNNNNQSNQGGQNSQVPAGMAAGMTPQMMAQYWQRMQQYFAMMQQQMAASAMGGGMGMNQMQMSPQMMQQWQQMQQMKQMQQGQQQGSMSPAPQSPGSQGMPNMAQMQGMNPQQQQLMMQQMMMQQGGMNGMGIPGQGTTLSPSGGGPPTAPSMGVNRPGYNAQEQLLFEQRKYEQQQARRAQIEQGGGGPGYQQMPQQAGSTTSWEGMYDDVPPPNTGGRGSTGVVRNLTPSNAGGPGKVPKGPGSVTPQPSAAPANAPTGPKNAGKPGANFRGGRGGGGRFHPYGR